jgi:hypothetical protein
MGPISKRIYTGLERVARLPLVYWDICRVAKNEGIQISPQGFERNQLLCASVEGTHHLVEWNVSVIIHQASDNNIIQLAQ